MKINKVYMRTKLWLILSTVLFVTLPAYVQAHNLDTRAVAPAPFNPMNVTIPEGASDQFTVFSRSDLTLKNGHNQASFAALNKFYNTDRNGNCIFNNIPAPQVDGKAVRLLAQEFGGGGGYMDFTDDYVKFGSTANLTLKQTGPTQVQLSGSSGNNNAIQVAKLSSGDLSDFKTSKSSVSSYFPDLSDTISRDKICLARIYSDPSTKKLSVQNGSIAGWDSNNINVLDYNDLSSYSPNNRVNFNDTPDANSILIIKVSADTTLVETKMWGMNAQHHKVPYVFWDLSEVTGDVYFDGFDIGALYAPYANVTVNLAPSHGSNGSFLANELEVLGDSGTEIHGVSFAGFPARFNCDASARIGDLVWHDENKNGIQDADELPMPNINVSLYQIIEKQEGGGLATNLVGTMATGEDGRYEFTVDPGTYILRVDPRDGYAFSPLNAGGSAVDSDFDRDHCYSRVFTVEAGEVNMDFDAGLYYAPMLSVITSFKAFTRGSDVFVAWTSAAEYDTLGYLIERKAADGSWMPINPDEELVWSALTGGATSYELFDSGARPGGTYTWRIVEIEGSGTENIYGPYTVTVDGAAADYDSWAAGMEWGNAASGSADDPDGDGLTNLEEFLAGTDPLDANSVLRISSIKSVENGMEIRWTSVEGKVYAVEHSKQLGAAWLPVKTGIVAEGPETSFVLPAADGGFFRVVLTEE